MKQNKDKEALLTQDRVKDLFNYDSETGILTNRFKRSYNELVGKEAGSMTAEGYRNVRINFILYRVHRVIWLYVHGEWPTHQIDHINGIRDDNRLENLRVVTHQENHKNQKRPRTNTSGIMGVCLVQGNYWKARIKVDGKDIHLYYGKDFFEACCARKYAENKYGFHANHGRASA